LIDLKKDPEKRFTVKDAINHPFFASCLPSKPTSTHNGSEFLIKNERKVLCEINNEPIRKNRDYSGIGNNIYGEKNRVSGHTKCFSTVTPGQIRMTENIPPNSIHVRPFDISSQPSREIRTKLHPDKLTQYLNTIDDSNIRKGIESSTTQRKVTAPMRTMSINRVIPHNALSNFQTPLNKEVIY